MNPVIVFPDVESVVVGWLTDVLPGYGITVPVATRVPNPRPSRFVRLVRTGGPRQNLVVDGAQLTVESWDDDPVAAASTAGVVRGVLLAANNVTFPSGDVIYQVREFSGPALLPDVSQQPRYTWTVQVHLRGVPL